MNTYTCIHIEDEPLAAKRLKDYVNRVPYLHYAAHYDSTFAGLDHLRSHLVDILFLDIHLDDMTGIEMLKSTKIDAQVILTTAHKDYALEGYALNVTDYLLKPFNFDRFIQAVNKATELQSVSLQKNGVEYIFIKTENRLDKVRLADILFIEGMRDYRRIHLLDKRIMTLTTFKDLEKLIPASKVCRVHKSYMVALDKIDSIQNGRIKLMNKHIPISETYREHLFAHINR